MIPDVFTRVAQDKVLTGAGIGGLFFSGSIDLSTQGASYTRDIGRGESIWARFEVTEAFVSAAGARLVWQVVVSADDDASFFSSNPVFLVRSPTLDGLLNLPSSALTLGAVFYLAVPSIPQHLAGLVPGRRYMGVLWNLSDANTFTAGKMTVDFGNFSGQARPPIYKSGVNGP